MSGEIKLFRRELFGGFARRDVIDYIGKLASERNSYVNAQKAAESEIETLDAAIKALRAELDESKRLIKEVRVEALDDAQRTLSELSNAYGDVRTDIETTANHIRGELLKAADTVTLMSQVLDRAGQRLNELGVIVGAEKAIAENELTASE